MGKVIVNNESSLPDSDALRACAAVIDEGRISDEGKSYCFATGTLVGRNSIFVYANRNKASDTFTVLDNK